MSGTGATGAASGATGTSQAVTSATSSKTTSPVGSYIERRIDLTFELGKGNFGDSGFNTVKLKGLRVVATIERYGPPTSSKAAIRAYGVTQSVMNQLSTLGAPIPMERDNRIRIEAGDDKNGMALAFFGNIKMCWQDLNSQPDTFLEIIAYTGIVDAIKPVAPISFPGTADVATIMSGIAVQMGRKFENNGVVVKLASPYFAGTAVAQAQAVAQAANIEMNDDGTTLAIWNKNGTRGGMIPLISPAGGLLGYPKYTAAGIQFRTIYNPNILYGGQIKMQSSYTPANGLWSVNGLNHDLSSQTPNGPWFCEVSAVRQAGSPGTTG